MKRLLKGGRVVDPANGRDGIFDVLIDGDCIAEVGTNLKADAGFSLLDALYPPAGTDPVKSPPAADPAKK